MNKHIKALDNYIENLEDKALQACIRDVQSHETGVLQSSIYYMIQDTKNTRLIDSFNQYVAMFNMPKELERFGFDWSKSYYLRDLKKDLDIILKGWKEIEFEFDNRATNEKRLSIYPATMLGLMKRILIFCRQSKPTKMKIMITDNFIHIKHNGSKSKDKFTVTNMNSTFSNCLDHSLFLERKVIERYFGEDSFSVWGEGFDDFKLKIKI